MSDAVDILIYELGKRTFKSECLQDEGIQMAFVQAFGGEVIKTLWRNTMDILRSHLGTMLTD